MGWFDWVPTVDETIEWIECRVAGHNWYNGKCARCGKKN